jgi:hypothetical protein
VTIGASSRGAPSSASKRTRVPPPLFSNVQRPLLGGPSTTLTAKARPGSSSVTSTTCSHSRGPTLGPSRTREPTRVGPSVSGVTYVLAVCQRHRFAGSAMNAQTSCGGRSTVNVSWMRTRDTGDPPSIAADSTSAQLVRSSSLPDDFRPAGRSPLT